jgi:hypothetical protein
VDINGTMLSNTNAGYLWTNVGVAAPKLLVGETTIEYSASSPAGVGFKLASGKTVYPLISVPAAGVSDAVTNMSALRINTINEDPLIVYTMNAPNISSFHSADASNVLVLKSNGFVGVGTETPLAPLTVVGTTASRALRVESTGDVASFTNTSNAGGLFINSNAYVGIGTQSPVSPLHVVGQAYVQGNFIGMSNMYVDKDLVVAGNTYTRFDQIVDSDRRLKTDLQRIAKALDKIDQLTGYTYNYTTASRRGTGLIAQDVLEVLPEATGSNHTTGYYGVEYGSMMGLVVEGIKELRAEVAELRRRLPI